MNRHVPPSPPVRVAHVRPGDLQHLVRKHEQLEDLIGAARSHAQPTARLWAAMVAIEDRMRIAHPRCLHALDRRLGRPHPTRQAPHRRRQHRVQPLRDPPADRAEEPP